MYASLWNDDILDTFLSQIQLNFSAQFFSPSDRMCLEMRHVIKVGEVIPDTTRWGERSGCNPSEGQRLSTYLRTFDVADKEGTVCLSENQSLCNHNGGNI